jgi:Tol biopolymer transport system component
MHFRHHGQFWAVGATALRGFFVLATALWSALQALSATAAAEEAGAKTGVTPRGRIFSQGFLYENDRPKGMGIAAIDPETGAWSRLPLNSSTFDVSPDGQTIVFSQENALWNSDTSEKPNPGKIFSPDGAPIFSPNGRELFVTTSKRNAADEQKLDTTVWKMAIDGTNASPAMELDGGFVRDCSSDGQWLLLMGPQRSVDLVRPDGKDRRQLVKSGGPPRFSPDGKQVAYALQWQGAIRTVDVDGTNDKILFQAPNLVFALAPQFGPDGKSVATILFDLQLGDDGKPQLDADAKISHPRIGVIDVGSRELRVLALPPQDGWEFAPVNRLVWR